MMNCMLFRKYWKWSNTVEIVWHCLRRATCLEHGFFLRKPSAPRSRLAQARWQRAKTSYDFFVIRTFMVNIICILMYLDVYYVIVNMGVARCLSPKAKKASTPSCASPPTTGTRSRNGTWASDLRWQLEPKGRTLGAKPTSNALATSSWFSPQRRFADLYLLLCRLVHICFRLPVWISKKRWADKMLIQ